MSENNGIRILPISFIRFFASIVIVYYHFGQNIYPFDVSMLLNHFVKHGYVWVSYFFVLSGFVLTVGYCNKPIDPPQFWISRFARIYPLHLIVILYYVVKYSFKENLLSSEIVLSVVLNLLLFQSWVPSFALSLNYPGWFLSVLCFFYLIFPYLYPKIKGFTFNQLIFTVFSFWFMSLVVLIILSKLAIYGGFPSNIILYNPLMHLNSFMVGIGGGLIFMGSSQKYEHSWIPFVMILLSLLLIVIIIYSPLIQYARSGLLSPIFIFLIIGLSRDTSFLSRLLSSKLLVFLGEISFALYIFHVPVYEVTASLMKRLDVQKPAYCFYSFMLILIVSSACIHTFIEKPVRRFIISLRKV